MSHSVQSSELQWTGLGMSSQSMFSLCHGHVHIRKYTEYTPPPPAGGKFAMYTTAKIVFLIIFYVHTFYLIFYLQNCSICTFSMLMLL